MCNEQRVVSQSNVYPYIRSLFPSLLPLRFFCLHTLNALSEREDTYIYNSSARRHLNGREEEVEEEEEIGTKLTCYLRLGPRSFIRFSLNRRSSPRWTRLIGFNIISRDHFQKYLYRKRIENLYINYRNLLLLLFFSTKIWRLKFFPIKIFSEIFTKET